MTSPTKARIIAHLQGDGGLYLRRNKAKVIRYFNKDIALISDFRRAIRMVYNVEAWKPSKGRTCWETGSGVTCILSDLRKYSLGTKNWRTPKSILLGKSATKVAYLQAYFDDEASVVLSKKPRGHDREIKVVSVNYRGLKDLTQLLKNFGILASVYGPYRGRYFELKIVKRKDLITYFERIGFNSQRKKKKLAALINSYKRGIHSHVN